MTISRSALCLIPVLSTLAACEKPAPPAPGASTKAAAPAPQPAESSPAAPHTHASSPPAPPPSVQPPAPAPGVKEDVADLASPTFTIGGVTITKPEGWTRVAPSNSMRKAELRIPAASGIPADDCVAAFSQAGGTVQWNLDRWKTQVTDAEGKPAPATTIAKEIDGLKLHVFESLGSYQDGMPGGAKTPRENWLLRGVVIETTPSLTFIKMWGPADAMKASTPAWEAMIAGIKKAP
jgi:hypothetical protein